MNHLDKALVYLGVMALAVAFKSGVLAALVIIMVGFENWD